MKKRNSVQLLLWCSAVFLALCAMPWVMDDEYMLEIFIILFINILLAMSYRLITTTGDWSFCHVVLFGVGAYATALITKFLGISAWISIPLSAFVASVVGGAFIYPLLRTKGFGFFIASFAIGEFVRLIWVQFHNPFGGSRGMIGIDPPELGSINFYAGTPYYYLALFVVTACLVAIYRLDRSRVGQVWKAIYADEDLAESVGIKVPRHRSQAFIIGSFFAGLGGALLAHRNGAIDPDSFDVNTMVYLVIWVVVGGTTTFWGPIIGVVLMTVIFEASRPLLEFRPLIFGGILIMTLLFMPNGLDGLMGKLRSRMSSITDPGMQPEPKRHST